MSSEFSDEERAAIYRVIHARRDMRHFCGGSIPEATLWRILAAAHAAPSVGLMQPWRFIRITDASLRARLADLVEQERQRTAALMGARRDEFLRLKVEGIRDCAELIAVVLAPDDGTVFGRRTMPEAMALCSASCAIENMWLAARAENLGMGWVSFFDPQAVAELLHCPAGAKPIALLCLGPVHDFYARPMLELEGWRYARPLAGCVGTNRFPDQAHG
ncbi:MAG: 5,6-dimethylbenzimidazole synthase [Zetaproteobacteria bacterium]|nr:MAG: 5,6-dimethylbenzimidazole synthase [Zetaproteobacteria bacterium]